MSSRTPASKPAASKAGVKKPSSRTAASTPVSSAAAEKKRGDGRTKVARHVDERVAARNSALNLMGGVKVDVFVRVRPPNEVEVSDHVSATADTETQQIVLLDPAGHEARYKYDKVYGPEASQEELYDDAVSPIVEQVCRGLSCCIFAYGQTGAGKTYTMRGDLSDNPAKHGIIQRSLRNLFRRPHEQDYTDISVKCSFLEIYNESLEDLLVDAKPTKKGAKVQETLNLVDHKKRGCVCKGLHEVDVDLSADDNGIGKLMAILIEAEGRCRYSETKMNKMSNRAHRIFNLVVNFKRFEKVVETTLTFVDLAGSEDIAKSGATGLTAREASHINKSLLTLGRVINALACNERHIPYRDSKLTRLLSEALGGVCKTSFIACISPCAGSSVESNSTLRYAERAMEALNISQLPRWKQDEIVIDGLTRRVQQLEADMQDMQKMHREDMQELQNERDALRQANEQLQRDLGKAERKIERLRARKAELKNGTALLNSQKGVLLSHKAALQDELLETRAERDGYLTDRGMLGTVLEQVRKMRERLLAAHRGTENALTTDALKLKGVIEGAVVDIDELHNEVARKKSLSVHNEKAADDFRDRISAKLRAVVQTVLDFRGAQDESHSGLKMALTDMRGSRQQATAALTADVARLAKAVEGTLTGLSQQTKEIEAARHARIGQGQDVASQHLLQLQDALDKTQKAVAQRLRELAEGATTLGGGLEDWADKIRAHCEATTDSSSRFAQDMASKVTALEAHLSSASEAQLAHLASHRASLEGFLQTEKATLAEHSQRMIADISGFVQRMVQDHTAQAQRRAEAAVAGFTGSTEAAEGQVRDMAAHQAAALAAAGSSTEAHDAAVSRAQAAAATASAAELATAQGLLAQTRATNETCHSELESGSQRTRTLGREQHERRMASLKEDAATATATTTALETVLSKARKDTAAAASALSARATKDLQHFGSQAQEMDGQLTVTHDGVRAHAGEAHDELFDTEAVAVKYVEQEVRRDNVTPPPHKSYVYPTEYAATDAYGSLLADVQPVWQREDAINQGTLTPGKGPDFPGEPGPDDTSGLLTTTQEQPYSEDEKHKLVRALYQSDVGEYSDPEGFVDPMDAIDEDDEEEEEEAEAEAEETAVNGATEEEQAEEQDGDVEGDV